MASTPNSTNIAASIAAKSSPIARSCSSFEPAHIEWPNHSPKRSPLPCT